VRQPRWHEIDDVRRRPVTKRLLDHAFRCLARAMDYAPGGVYARSTLTTKNENAEQRRRRLARINLERAETFYAALRHLVPLFAYPDFEHHRAEVSAWLDR